MPKVDNAVLAALRADPVTVFDKYGFRIASDAYQNRRDGGQCALGCSLLNDNVYSLAVDAGGTGDWFYPYNNASVNGGVGLCDVPVGQSPGSIVVTGGMNGCALHVYRHAGGFRFIHDSNGSSLAANSPDIVGKRVAHVVYNDYDRMSLGQLASIAKNSLSTPSSSVGGYFENYIITVKHDGRWKVFVSGLIQTRTISSGFFGSTDTRSFETYRGSIVRLITSFEDV
jgi:hypothetical protein